MVGRTAGPYAHDIDARWLMAYAAALEETAPEYFDTTRPEGLVAHPLFSVCYEWPAAVELRAKLTSEEIAARSVHATHDLVIHRPVKAGDRLETTATVSLIEPRSPGAYQVTRFETIDERGQPVTTTEYGSIYRSVSVDPAPVRPKGSEPMENESSNTGEGWSTSVPLNAGLAHVYTECARIWNPIHTDEGVARAAGLPGIILHGTATLALCIARVVSRDLGDDPARVHGVSARFTGMVTLPSTFVLRAARPTARGIAFDAVGRDGRPILDRGALST